MYMMYSKSSSMMIMHLGQRKMCNARCIRTFIVTFSLDLETKGAVWSVCDQGQQLALLAAVLLIFLLGSIMSSSLLCHRPVMCS